MTWRAMADWAKTRPTVLRLVDGLGLSRGRTRLLDRLGAPPTAPLKPDLRGWNDRGLAAVWIGHATVLLRVGGVNILTDPVLYNRIGVGLGLITAGPRRLVAPALRMNELPRIDLVLISHAHYDHLDRTTLCRFPRGTAIVTARGCADLLRDLGFASVAELEWGQSCVVRGVRISALPGRHWGARSFHDSHRGHCSFLIQAAGRRILYVGDTGYHEQFVGVGPVDLAMIGIGAYNPYIEGHASPEQAWRMTRHAEARHVLPMHHGTFLLSLEPPDEPLRRLLAAAGSDAGRIVIRQIGGMWDEAASAETPAKDDAARG